MTIQDKLRKLALLCTLIKKEQTGGIRKLAEAASLTKSSTFNYLRELKVMGAEIEYDPHRHTYYFNNNFDFKYSINLK
jgi:DNA-binding IclR family transcriptional regulator